MEEEELLLLLLMLPPPPPPDSPGGFLGRPRGRGLGTHLKPKRRHRLQGMDLCV